MKTMTEWFSLWMESITYVPIAKLALFTVNKGEWDTKEGTSKFIKNAFYEGNSQAEVTSSWSMHDIKSQ